MDETRQEISGDVECFPVDPTQYEPLKHFSCGDAGPWEKQVNSLIAAYANGWEVDDSLFRVAVERPNGSLIGVAGHYPRGALEFEDRQLKQFQGSGFLSIIGVNKEYRRKAKGGRTMGDYVLDDTLEQIRVLWGMRPWVFTHVGSGNKPCETLLKRHYFNEMTSPLWGRPAMP
jgi:hypothetical protein